MNVLMVIIVLSLSNEPGTGKVLAKYQHKVTLASSLELCQKVRDDLANPTKGTPALVLCIQPEDIDLNHTSMPHIGKRNDT